MRVNGSLSDVGDLDADYQKVSQVLTNLNADSPLSGKQSKIGSKNHNQSSKKAFFVVIFHEVLHKFFWQACSISSALWWISQPYSARAVRLEQRASVIIALLIKNQIFIRGQR